MENKTAVAYKQSPSEALPWEEKLAWLRLSRTKNVGAITFYELLRRFGTASQALAEIPRLAQRGGARDLVFPCTEPEARQEWERIEAFGAHLLFRDDPLFPQALKTLPDCPPILTIKGNLDILNKSTIAIVGARNASLNGKKFAEKIARELGEKGYKIVSGLARGVDTHAHRASLSTGTLAVVAGGINVIYPEENKGLYEQILEKGAIVAESPFGVAPQSHFFPKRNRLISGLSLGVVVVEAAIQSGSLITANYALEQNREIFAVPGSPFDPRCHGVNNLIRQGATLIQNVTEIIEGLPSQTSLFQSREIPSFYEEGISPPPKADRYEKIREDLLTNLSYTPTSIDELIRHCLASPAEVLYILLELELAGRIERHAGNKVAYVEK